MPDRIGDGVTAIAEWRGSGSDIVLDIPSYRTAKGTQIAPRTWRLVQRADGLWRSLRTS